MQGVLLFHLYYKQKNCIGIKFKVNRAIHNAIRKLKGVRWSQTNTCWLVTHTKDNLATLLKAMPPGVEVTLEGLQEIEIVQAVQETINHITTQKNVPANDAQLNRISLQNLEELARMMEMLQLKAYSVSTIKTYKNEFCQLLKLLRNRQVSLMSADEIKRYMLYCVGTLKLSENTIHSRLNALKFYFEQVLKREKVFFEIPRPKKHFQLPKVLGEREIGKLFNALENKKHKAILFTAYSAGLRVSEVVSLQIKDIDSDRMQIFVENAKGKKDRYVMLSPVLLDILRSYLKICSPRPTTYLFEGYEPGVPFSSRSAQNIFFQAKRKAGLKKELSFHSLRHSFATHLLENGVDIKYIKDLLGHFSIHTTNRYLHVKRESLVNIISPLDAIYKSGKMDF